MLNLPNMMIARTLILIFLSVMTLSACGGSEGVGEDGPCCKNPTNVPPTADDLSFTVDEDIPEGITLTGHDLNDDPCTYHIASGPTHGTLSGTAPQVTYTPDANYSGSDSFSFYLNDGEADSNTAFVSITVNVVNDPPVAGDDSLNLTDKSPVSGTLTGSDIEGDGLTFKLLTLPTKGTVVLNDPATGAYTYTPATIGADSFAFNINDGDRDSNLGRVNVFYPDHVAPPETPANPTAEQGDQRVTVNWDTVDYAESYNIYWSNSIGDTGTISGVHQPFYHKDLQNGNTYNYEVTAVNSQGESQPSSEVSATPEDIPISSLTFADENLKDCVDEKNAEYVHDLTLLDCSSTGISDLAGIEALSSLTSLGLNGNSISDISALAGLVELSYLQLVQNSISDISALSGMVELNHLNLYDNSITDISPMSGLANLTILSLAENNISDIGALSDLGNLTLLALKGNNTSDISALSGLVELNLLNLISNSISDISALAGLDNLTELYLNGNNICDISALAGMGNLTRLELSGSNISNISVLAILDNLTVLNLGINNISDISVLAGLGNLTGLYLDRNNIRDISALGSLVELNSLDLNNNNIGSQRVVGYVDALTTLTQASNINLNNNPSMSCGELDTLLDALNVAGKTVVQPDNATDGSTCTNP